MSLTTLFSLWIFYIPVQIVGVFDRSKLNLKSEVELCKGCRRNLLPRRRKGRKNITLHKVSLEPHTFQNVKRSPNAKGFLFSQFQPSHLSCRLDHVNFAYRCHGFGTICGFYCHYSVHLFNVMQVIQSIPSIWNDQSRHCTQLSSPYNTLFIKSPWTTEVLKQPLNPEPKCPQKRT